MTFLLCTSRAYGWLDPAAGGVSVIPNTEDNQFAFYSGPTGQDEWLLNFGASTSIRAKGYDDPAALKWDLSFLQGATIIEAELHLCLTSGSQINALVASTINMPWNEGTKYGSTAGAGDSCWRWRSYPDVEWTYPGSDFSTATFGNFGTLVSFGYSHADTFRRYSDDGNNWVAMKLDPSLVYAMILDNHGLTVTDPRFGFDNGNPKFFTSEQNSMVQPRLYISYEWPSSISVPNQVTSATVEPGEGPGEAVLSFDAPETSPHDNPAFGYEVRYATDGDFDSAGQAERWRIPRPGAQGSRDRLLLEGLESGSTYMFWVKPYEKHGYGPDPVMVSMTVPEYQSPSLKQGTEIQADPEGKSIQEIPGVLRYWACSELAKVNPLTGNRITDGYTSSGSDDYKKANAVWDAAANTILLHPVRNQIVGFQVIIERLLPSLTGLSVEASDLVGPGGAIIDAADNLEFFRLHYSSDSVPYPDPAIPLSFPFSDNFSIPSVNNSGGVFQSIWADLYIPRDAVPGDYSGMVQIDGNELTEPVVINLQVAVTSPVLPDSPTFFLDLNGYGNKWSSTASRYQVFQLAHKHRMVPNTLPYGWAENWLSDRTPQLSGSGSSLAIDDWGDFAEYYGPFFDGSAFSPDHPEHPYHGPGELTGIANFYTTGFEGWPISISDPAIGYDGSAIGGQGHAYWKSLVDAGGTDIQSFWLESPDVMEAFPESYSEGTRNVWRDFAEYAQAHGWTTAFQYYLNNKRSYSGTSALWTLEEQYVADDFRADAFFMKLCREGWESANAPDTRFQWRIDTSTRWQQNWGQLRGIANLRVQGDGKYWDYRQDRYRRYTEQQPEQRWWYGTGPGRENPLFDHAAEILLHWSHGMDGGLPYWDTFQNNWTTAEGSDSVGEDADLSLMLSGSSVPGHGYFDGRIATVRMKGMRYGQQLAELLNLLAAQPGWNRNRVARALSDRYGDHSGTGYDAFGGDEYNGLTISDYFALTQDIIASLELCLLRGDINNDRVIDLRDAIGALQVQVGVYEGTVRLEADVDDDGRVGMTEALFILHRETQP